MCECRIQPKPRPNGGTPPGGDSVAVLGSFFVAQGDVRAALDCVNKLAECGEKGAASFWQDLEKE